VFLKCQPHITFFSLYSIYIWTHYQVWE